MLFSTSVIARAVVAARLRCALHTERIVRDERGQATAEYGVVLLVAIALGMAVLMLFTGKAFDGVLSSLLKKVLSVATGMIH